MPEEERKTDQSEGKAWPFVMSWAGRISALIGLFGALAGGVTWFINHHRQNAELKAKMAVAEAEQKQGDYPTAIQSYGEILKGDPLYQPALDEQLSTTMQWAENFHVFVPEGQSTTGAAAPAIDQILTILDAGLARSKGAKAADVQAHIGWTHWLNQHIAEREFGPATEQNLRAALTTEPTNVYANAMLGNWMLQNNGDFSEAVHHFDIADATGRARPFVRTLELGGLLHLEEKGARSEEVKIANAMRKSGEPLDPDTRSRILSYCFAPGVTNQAELTESLTAVPSDEAWSTYLWLAEPAASESDQKINRDFVHASLLEATGKRNAALGEYRSLQQRLKAAPGEMKDSVDAAIVRLSRS